MSQRLIAGAAAVDITPTGTVFLYGYPHVPRMSTGVHDPLLSSALFLSDGRTAIMFIANDLIFVGKETANNVRHRIAERVSGLLSSHIMVTATHTHSGPVTVDQVSAEADPVVPEADADYLRRLEDGMVEAAVQAVDRARPAEVGLAVAEAVGLGTNRHDPAGPADPFVPVLVVRAAGAERYLAAMLVCSMHPTVLHEGTPRW